MLRITLHFEDVAPLTAEQFNCRFIGREFVGGQQIDGFDFFQRTLAVDVKHPQAVNFVIKEIKTIREFAAHREEIQQRTARSVFAVFHHLINMAISGAVQLCAQSVARQTLAFFHYQRMTVEKTVRTDTLHKRIHRNNQYAALHRWQLVKGRKA